MWPKWSSNDFEHSNIAINITITTISTTVNIPITTIIITIITMITISQTLGSPEGQVYQKPGKKQTIHKSTY